MGNSFVAMRFHAGNLGLKQRYPIIKFAMRIGVKRLRTQLAGQIACAARALFKFHRRALCGRLDLAVNRLHRYLALRVVYYLAGQTGGAAAVEGGMA